ncbi:hypothetical protein COT72_03885 [archaeon CG10_big_fil_rev_8_21_14_0_10_43_11]|nr:MAG: hypothetical protein COT72_03885 [archaeon CG10_big_fil_rev_8_21_14_0_10_43_11]
MNVWKKERECARNRLWQSEPYHVFHFKNDHDAHVLFENLEYATDCKKPQEHLFRVCEKPGTSSRRVVLV